jgi:hypothetical protein
MNNPVNVALIALALTIGYKYTSIRNPQVAGVDLYRRATCNIPASGVSVSPVFPHWSGPAYVTLTPVAAIWLAQFNHKKLFHRSLGYSISAFALFIIGWQAAINYMPGTLGSKNEQTLGQRRCNTRPIWMEGSR